MGHASVGWQNPSVRFEERLADDSILGLIARGNNRHRHNTPLLGKGQ